MNTTESTAPAKAAGLADLATSVSVSGAGPGDDGGGGDGGERLPLSAMHASRRHVANRRERPPAAPTRWARPTADLLSGLAPRGGRLAAVAAQTLLALHEVHLDDAHTLSEEMRAEAADAQQQTTEEFLLQHKSSNTEMAELADERDLYLAIYFKFTISL